MSKQRILEEASLGEVIQAKARAVERRFDDWFETGNNAEKLFAATFAGFSALSAGAETTANLLREREGRKGQLQRGALHAATLVSLAGAGASLVLEGAVLSDREASKR